MSNHGYSSYLNVSPKLPLYRKETSFVAVLMHSRKQSTAPSFPLSAAHRVFKTWFLQQWPSAPLWGFLEGTSIASFMTDGKDLKCDHYTLFLFRYIWMASNHLYWRLAIILPDKQMYQQYLVTIHTHTQIYHIYMFHQSNICQLTYTTC
jgi:hypothetical protein